MLLQRMAIDPLGREILYPKVLPALLTRVHLRRLRRLRRRLDSRVLVREGSPDARRPGGVRSQRRGGDLRALGANLHDTWIKFRS